MRRLINHILHFIHHIKLICQQLYYQVLQFHYYRKKFLLRQQILHLILIPIHLISKVIYLRFHQFWFLKLKFLLLNLLIKSDIIHLCCQLLLNHQIINLLSFIQLLLTSLQPLIRLFNPLFLTITLIKLFRINFFQYHLMFSISKINLFPAKHFN